MPSNLRLSELVRRGYKGTVDTHFGKCVVMTESSAVETYFPGPRLGAWFIHENGERVVWPTETWDEAAKVLADAVLHA